MKPFSLLLALLVLFLVSGCGTFSPPEIVKHPDTSLLVMEVQGEYFKAAVYSKADNKMFEYGWIHVGTMSGWTLTKYDWESLIDRRKRENGDD